MMPAKNFFSAYFFGFSQAVILIAIIIALLVHRKKVKEAEKSYGVDLDKLGDLPKINRVPVPKSELKNSDAPLSLTSIFPHFAEQTPWYEVLGVSPNASKKEIEKAYRVLLVQFHPDRFAQYGESSGYQKRAHYTLQLIQAAKEKGLKELLKK